MVDRPILFSAPMVRALLDGRKTQTRRLAKFIEPDGDGWHIRNSGGGMLGADDDAVRVSGPDYAPFAVGDRLWVKETWHAEASYDDTKPSEIPSDACNVLYAVAFMDGIAARARAAAWAKSAEIQKRRDSVEQQRLRWRRENLAKEHKPKVPQRGPLYGLDRDTVRALRGF